MPYITKIGTKNYNVDFNDNSTLQSHYKDSSAASETLKTVKGTLEASERVLPGYKYIDGGGEIHDIYYDITLYIQNKTYDTYKIIGTHSLKADYIKPQDPRNSINLSANSGSYTVYAYPTQYKDYYQYKTPTSTSSVFYYTYFKNNSITYTSDSVSDLIDLLNDNTYDKSWGNDMCDPSSQPSMSFLGDNNEIVTTLKTRFSNWNTWMQFKKVTEQQSSVTRENLDIDMNGVGEREFLFRCPSEVNNTENITHLAMELSSYSSTNEYAFSDVIEDNNRYYRYIMSYNDNTIIGIVELSGRNILSAENQARCSVELTEAYNNYHTFKITFYALATYSHEKILNMALLCNRNVRKAGWPYIREIS